MTDDALLSLVAFSLLSLLPLPLVVRLTVPLFTDEDLLKAEAADELVANGPFSLMFKEEFSPPPPSEVLVAAAATFLLDVDEEDEVRETPGSRFRPTDALRFIFSAVVIAAVASPVRDDDDDDEDDDALRDTLLARLVDAARFFFLSSEDSLFVCRSGVFDDSRPPLEL